MPAKEIHKSATDSNISPSRIHFAIAPSDANELPYVTKSIHIGTAPAGGGALAVLGAADSEPVIYKGLQSGQAIIGAFRKVMAAGTSCSDLIGEA